MHVGGVGARERRPAEFHHSNAGGARSRDRRRVGGPGPPRMFAAQRDGATAGMMTMQAHAAAFMQSTSPMIEQPSTPDIHRPPDPIDRPPPDISPVPPPDIPPPAG